MVRVAGAAEEEVVAVVKAATVAVATAQAAVTVLAEAAMAAAEAAMEHAELEVVELMVRARAGMAMGVAVVDVEGAKVEWAAELAADGPSPPSGTRLSIHIERAEHEHAGSRCRVH